MINWVCLYRYNVNGYYYIRRRPRRYKLYMRFVYLNTRSVRGAIVAYNLGSELQRGLYGGDMVDQEIFTEAINGVL